MGQGGARRESEDRITGRKQCLRQERSGSFSDFGSRSIACVPPRAHSKAAPPRDFGPSGAPTTYFFDPDIVAVDPSFEDLAQPNTAIKRRQLV